MRNFGFLAKKIALDLSCFLNAHSNVARWAAEPVTFIWIPASTFISNAKSVLLPLKTPFFHFYILMYNDNTKSS